MKGHVQKRGQNSWRIKYDIGRDPKTGKRRIAYVTIRGRRTDADAELRRRLTAVDKGVHVDPVNLTVATYLETWLADTAPENVGPKALERYRGLVRNQVNPHIGDIQLQQLRPRDVKAWISTLGKTGISVRSVRHAHGVLRTALADAASSELIERNVATLVKLPKITKKKPTILKAEDIADALAKIEGLSIYPIVAVALGTGARRGEIAALRWSDIDFQAETVRVERSLEQTKAGIRVKSPKTESGYRTITLPAFALAALRDHRRQQLELRIALGMGALPTDAPIFGTIEGDWPNPYSISDRWRDAVKIRKLPTVTFHSLRHSHASALIAANLDVVSISRRLGHASPALTLSIYSHLFENKDEKAASAIDAAFARN